MTKRLDRKEAAEIRVRILRFLSHAPLIGCIKSRRKIHQAQLFVMGAKPEWLLANRTLTLECNSSVDMVNRIVKDNSLK